MKLASRIKKVQEDVSSLKEECPKLLAAKQVTVSIGFELDFDLKYFIKCLMYGVCLCLIAFVFSNYYTCQCQYHGVSRK